MVGERLIREWGGAIDERRRFFLRGRGYWGILAAVRNEQAQIAAPRSGRGEASRAQVHRNWDGTGEFD
jgi:hypothetical protein